MTGSIDRLVLMRQGGKVVAADVIDFKTDEIGSDGESTVRDRTEFYRPQVEAYQRAVSKMYRIESERIVGRLLFLSAGIVRSLSLSQTETE